MLCRLGARGCAADGARSPVATHAHKITHLAPRTQPSRRPSTAKNQTKLEGKYRLTSARSSPGLMTPSSASGVCSPRARLPAKRASSAASENVRLPERGLGTGLLPLLVLATGGAGLRRGGEECGLKWTGEGGKEGEAPDGGEGGETVREALIPARN